MGTTDSGQLSRTKFYIMMHLVVKYRNSKDKKSFKLPSKLPYFLEPEFIDALGTEQTDEPAEASSKDFVVPAVKNDTPNENENWGFGDGGDGDFAADFDAMPA